MMIKSAIQMAVRCAFGFEGREWRFCTKGCQDAARVELPSFDSNFR